MTLHIEDLTVIYDPRQKNEQALSHFQLTVQPGEFVGVLGRSGAGKSTLIRCINQLVRPTQGKVIWNGQDMVQLNGQKLRKARRDMGMIFQQFHLIPRLTALQNCALGIFAYRSTWQNVIGTISAEERKRALSCLQRVGIDYLAEKRVDRLSGGQQQRVAIARVLMQQPQLLLGDEPVASLDPVTTRQVMELIQNIHHTDQMTTIVNLHDVNVAIQFCDRIIGLHQGKKVYDGPPGEVDDAVLDQIYV